jgi:small subunit ribosomal protein S1
MNQKNKRTRITTVELDRTVERFPEPQNEIKPKKVNEIVFESDAYYDENGEFMWDAYEATCPSRLRKPNPHIKTRKGDRVYSREAYAQELYDMMESNGYHACIPTVDEGSIYDGTIHGVSHEFISVDIGYRELIYVKYEKETDTIKALKPGDETAVLITGVKTNSHILGSISGGVKQKIFLELRNSVEEGNTAYVGTVTNMIENGGYIVDVQGVECFMPGSLAGINKLVDFESIIGTEMYVAPVTFSAERGTIVVSHRKYLQAMIPNEIENIKQNMDSEYVGNVTGTAKYGVFVEFNKCLTGMIHVNDLDEETMPLFKAREIKPGDEIKFKIKDIITDTKITLTQKDNAVVNPWADISKRYQIPSTIEAVVKTKKEYGIFINIEEGVTGLLHISEFDETLMNVFNPGDKITVQITRIDVESKKVFLKLP